MINGAQRHSCHARQEEKKLDPDAETLSAGEHVPRGEAVRFSTAAASR